MKGLIVLSAENFQKVKQVLWTILFANLAVAALKVIFGIIIKSSSMTADGFHSLTDGSSNIIGLIGINLASKPIDEDHPYGHRKFETLTGLFISGMLVLIGGKIILNSISRFINPVIPEITFFSLIVLISTLCVNIFVYKFENKKGHMLASQILIADSFHTRSDIYITIGVLFTLISIKLGLPPIIDPIASIIVSGFILYAAYEIFTENSDVLVDKVAIDEKKIRDIVIAFDQVRDVHNIRSRGSKNDLYIDMHIMTDPDLTVEESHELTHEIEGRIRKEVNETAQVITHIEPYEKKD